MINTILLAGILVSMPTNPSPQLPIEGYAIVTNVSHIDTGWRKGKTIHIGQGSFIFKTRGECSKAWRFLRKPRPDVTLRWNRIDIQGIAYVGIGKRNPCRSYTKSEGPPLSDGRILGHMSKLKGLK